jgi:hypothetical protein
MVFFERPRRNLGALVALQFQVECVEQYTRALDLIHHENDVFDPWIEREMAEIVKSGMRKNYELRFADKKHPNLYREDVEGGDRVMEHVVPISHWYALYSAAPSHLRHGVFFMAWAGPIANITKASDKRFKGSAETHFNKTICRPFARYMRAGIKVVQVHPDGPTGNMSLADHYRRLDDIEFMRPLMAFARENYHFEEALQWVNGTNQIVAAVARSLEA